MSRTFTPKENLRGGLFIALSMAGFLVNDAIVKHLAASLPVGQIMMVRGFMMLIILLLFSIATGALRPISTFKNKHLSLRVIGEVFATITFLSALAHLPLSNAQAILQALPLAVTLGAAVVLGEAVGWKRWSAIFVGFIGVMLIVQPGLDGFNVYSLLVLACVAGATLRDLATRLLDPTIPGLFVSIATTLAVIVIGGCMTLYTGWFAMDLQALSLCFVAACFIAIGYYFIIEGMRVGETAFVTPFRYTILIWALIVGYIFFGEVPNALMLIGCFIVVAMGLYTLHRERKLAAKQDSSPE